MKREKIEKYSCDSLTHDSLDSWINWSLFFTTSSLQLHVFNLETEQLWLEDC